MYNIFIDNNSNWLGISNYPEGGFETYEEAKKWVENRVKETGTLEEWYDLEEWYEIREEKMKFLTHIDGVAKDSNGLNKSVVVKTTANELIDKFGDYIFLSGFKKWFLLSASGKRYVIVDYNSRIEVFTSDGNIEELGLITKPNTRILANVIVNSFTSSNEYNVSLHSCGKFSCSCKDYQKREYHECKHIKRVKNELEQLVKVR